MAFYAESVLSEFLVLATTLFIVVYLYFQWAYQYWAKRKCPFLPPKFPTGASTVLVRRTFTFTLESVQFYNEIKRRGLKFAGIYMIINPVLVVIDPEYIRDIMSKDFSYFVDRGFYYNEKDDPVSAHLFALDDTNWKNIRTKLTPTFTSGKMKTMYNSILHCSNFMVNAIEKCAENMTDIDLKSYLSSFTVDVIGTCAFGIDCNSFEDPNSKFKKMGEKLFDYDGIWRSIELFIIANMPNLSLKLGLKAINPEISAFFRDLVERTVSYRETNNYKRPDFLQLLIDMKNNTKDSDVPFTMDELAAQVFLFFIAGYDTSSTTMYFTLYELCKNPEIQEKTRKEILDVLERHGGEITYESLGEMKYLQQVIDEGQRIYPPVVNLTRKCVKDYTLRDTDITIEKGTEVLVPLYSLQNDPEYFPNPEKFDPDRFTLENKALRHPYIHLPFGDGPRNCIGLRFGLMQSKVGLVSILRKFRLKISPTTKMPLHLDMRVFLMKTLETLYVTAEKV